MVPEDSSSIASEKAGLVRADSKEPVAPAPLEKTTRHAKPSKGGRDPSELFGKSTDQALVYPNNGFDPRVQSFMYGGYPNSVGIWGQYSPYFTTESYNAASAGVQNVEQLLMQPTGHEYTQMPYGVGTYTPVPSPSPVYGDSHSSFYGHTVPLSGQYYVGSPGAVAADSVFLQDNNFLFDNYNQGGFLYPSPSSGYLNSYGSYGDVSAQAGGGLFGQSVAVQPTPNGMHPGLFYDSTSYRVVPHSGKYIGAGSSHASVARASALERGYNKLLRGNSTVSRNPYALLEFMNEQNRGPRSVRLRKQPTEGPTTPPPDGGKSEKKAAATLVDLGTYNSPEFLTEHDDARFFVIKSYTEDNVHKSIKYGVWASTTSGNKKLDLAYREAGERPDRPAVPVFLLFSVNGSAQFCGVAEMTGPVDFERSADFWQQDKWRGQFPVRWQIIKDVPNSLLHHVVLDNNDYKPVTNSRDTQEVMLEKGLEILSIFKSYEAPTSILDDFDFYDKREKAMTENRKRQLLQQKQLAAAVELREPTEDQADAAVSHLSQVFAKAVQLDGSGEVKDGELGGSAAGVPAAAAGAGAE